MGYHPGQGLNVDGLGSGFSQRFGAFIDRGSRGEHVIHDQHAFPLNGGRGRHGKALSKIFQTLSSCEGRLGKSGFRSPEHVGEHGKIPLFAQMVG